MPNPSLDTRGSLMRAEIFEQPKVLTQLLSTAQPIIAKTVAHMQRQACAYAGLAARGSSDNASVYGKYLLESLAKLPVALAAPSLYTLYKAPPRLNNAFVVGVSQSGHSLDIVNVVETARAQGAVTLGITNTPDSPLTRAAEHNVLLNAGLERALAATKTVAGQCMTYAMLAHALVEQMGEKSPLDLAAIADEASSALALEASLAQFAREWRFAGRAAVIGRGYCYSAAQEMALKLKETTFITAEAYSAADFMHGPLALVEPGYAMIVLLNHDATLDTTVELLRKARERGAQPLVIATREASQAAEAHCIIDADAMTSNIAFIIAGQLFALHLSLLKGYNPDVSRGVSKVTVTQ
ncbi:MAG: SIS domain-containing protein [Anaerolineae bacterium]|nr:SIS domain-containing protein [Anaerolineae bacterium]